MLWRLIKENRMAYRSFKLQHTENFKLRRSKDTLSAKGKEKTHKNSMLRNRMFVIAMMVVHYQVL